MSDLIDNNILLILIIMLFVFVTYLQRQVNQLSQTTENFDANSDNVAAINNLGKLAGDILNKNALNIPVSTTINGNTTISGTVIIRSKTPRTDKEENALDITNGSINIRNGYLAIRKTPGDTTFTRLDPLINIEQGSITLWDGDIKAVNATIWGNLTVIGTINGKTF